MNSRAACHVTWGQRSWWQWRTLCTCSCCWSSCVRPAWPTSLQPPASPELSPRSSLVHTHTHTHTMYTHTPFLSLSLSLSLSLHQAMICFWSAMCGPVSQPCSLCTALSRCCQPSTSPSPFQACPHSMSCESSFHTISSLHSMMSCYWSAVVFPVTLFTFLSPSPGLLVCLPCTMLFQLWDYCGVFCIIGKPVQL